MLMPMTTIVARKLEIQTSSLQGMVVLPRCTLRPVLGNTQAIKLRRPISGSHCTVSESQPVPSQCNAMGITQTALVPITVSIFSLLWSLWSH